MPAAAGVPKQSPIQELSTLSNSFRHLDDVDEARRFVGPVRTNGRLAAVRQDPEQLDERLLPERRDDPDDERNQVARSSSRLPVPVLVRSLRMSLASRNNGLGFTDQHPEKVHK